VCLYCCQCVCWCVSECVWYGVLLFASRECGCECCVGRCEFDVSVCVLLSMCVLVFLLSCMIVRVPRVCS